jgi:hypothetical protein
VLPRLSCAVSVKPRIKTDIRGLKEAFSSSASSSANNSETECEEEEESEEQQDGESGSEYSPSNTQDSSKQKPHAARKQRAKVRFTRTGATQNKALVLAKEMMNTALSQLNLIENEYTKTLQRLGKEVEEARKALREYRQREGSAGHDHGDCKREIAELKAAVKVRDRELVARYE